MTKDLNFSRLLLLHLSPQTVLNPVFPMAGLCQSGEESYPALPAGSLLPLHLQQPLSLHLCFQTLPEPGGLLPAQFLPSCSPSCSQQSQTWLSPAKHQWYVNGSSESGSHLCTYLTWHGIFPLVLRNSQARATPICERSLSHWYLDLTELATPVSHLFGLCFIYSSHPFCMQITAF